MANYDFLKRTSRKGRSGHRHLVYLKGEIGMTSTDKGHSHRVILNEDGVFEVLPEDGHEHLIEEFEFNEVSVPNEMDSETVSDCVSLFRAAENGENDFRKEAKIAEDQFYGDQWKDSDKRKVEGEDRPALTFNEVEPKIDLLCGYQAKNRTDIRYLPTENGDSRVADILTVLVKNITEQNLLEYEESEVFCDEVITGRGIFDVDVDYERNLDGDIKISSGGWDSCYFGPHDKKTAEDNEYLIKDRWFSLAKLKQLWPEKAEKIYHKYWPGPSEGEPLLDNPGDQYAVGDLNLTVDLDPTLVDIGKKEFRVLEIWRKEYSRVTVAVDAENDVYISTDGWPKADIKSIKTIPAFSCVERKVTRSRVTKIAGGVVLEDEYSDLFDGLFPCIPAYAKKRKKKVWGKVRAMIDPQREVNKRRSQIADILNKVAAYGWFYDDETFPDETEERKFKRNSSRPGFTQKVSDSKNPPNKVEGVRFPSELAAFEEIASKKMNEISNINLELLGMSSNVTSGIAIAERKKSGLIGNEFLFDGLSLAKKQLGRVLISLIQKVYTTDRILRVIESRASKNPNEQILIGGQQMQQYRREDLEKILETDDLSQYDVVVTESQYSATARQAAFFMWAELAGQGLPVPPTYLADLSDAPKKDQLIQGMVQMIQAEQQAEQQKHQTELIKTLIAKSGDKGGDTGSKNRPE